MAETLCLVASNVLHRGLNSWPATKAKRVLAALLRI